MKRFESNDFFKYLINGYNKLSLDKKNNLESKINFQGLTSLEIVKITEGILNYGVVLTDFKDIPRVDCRKLNTGVYLILKYYKTMDYESLLEGLDSILEINLDSTKGGFIEEDLDLPKSAVLDVLKDYAFGSSPEDISCEDIPEDEISLYRVNVSYGNVDRIRDFNKEVFE